MTDRLFCAFDQAFFEHAAPLILSYKHFFPYGKIVTWTVNCDQNDIRRLPVDDNIVGQSSKDPYVYITIKRFVILADYLHTIPDDDRILALDADTLVSGDVMEIYEWLDKYDMISKVDLNRPKRNRFLGGALLMRNCKSVRKFLDEYKELYLDPAKRRKIIKCSDQVWLYKLWLKYVHHPKKKKLRWNRWPRTDYPLEEFSGKSRMYPENVEKRMKWMSKLEA